MQEVPYRVFDLKLKTDQPFHLPAYAGSMLRGAFGHSFRRICCAFKTRQCESCLLSDRCHYFRIFETRVDELGKPNTGAHPYILRPVQAVGGGTTEQLDLQLTLIGEALDALPYFIYAIIEMGERGLGKERIPFELAEVSTGGKTIYTGRNPKLADPGPPPRFGDLMKEPTETTQQLTIRLLTPLRAKINGKLAACLTFPDVIRLSMRRVRELCAVLDATDPFFESARGLLDGATDITCTRASCRWYDWIRYSNRQQTKMRLGGLIGVLTFTGPLHAYLPLLRLMEVCHLGKNTSFGLGKIEVTDG